MARSTGPLGVARVAALLVALAVAATPAARASAQAGDPGFTVTPGSAPDFAAAYAEAHSSGLPAFITTDCALALSRSLLEEVLLRVEDRVLYARLVDLSRALVRLSEQQYLRASEPTVREAARRNIAFFAVPLSLLDRDYFPPESARALVERELALIERGEGITFSPIMGSTPLDGVAGPGEDYSAYVPRGRAAEDERLGRFHRAVTWYSRMAFALPEGRVLDYGLTMQALLVAEAIQSEAGDWLELWRRVYDPLAFYLGGSGDPTVSDYAQIANGVFGEGYDTNAVADQGKLAAFAELVGKVAPSHFETHELRGLRFLARPTLPDTRYFARLAGPADSSLPTGLDLAGLLGSAWARGALERREAFASDLYRRGFEEIRRELAVRTYGEWTGDLPTSWLYALAAVAASPPPGSPAFMTTPQWGAKEASTIAAGWALARRDPVGFGGPRGGSVAGGGDEAQDAGAAAAPGGVAPLVEPYPLLYGRLREIIDHVRDRLWANDLLDGGIEALLAGHRDFLASLEVRSQGALSGAAGGRGGRGLDDPVGYVASFGRPVGAAGSAHGGPGADEAFLARSFTDLVSGRVLWAGGGRPDGVRVVARDADGASVAYHGAVLSYREMEVAPDGGAASPGAEGRSEFPPRPSWLAGLVEGH